jgi:hypothetical protein
MRRALALAAALLVLVAAALPQAASDLSLDSSTVAVRVLDEHAAEATISVAVETLDQVLAADLTSSAGTAAIDDAVVAYLDEHLTVTGADGTAWKETDGAVVRATVEGFDSLSVVVRLDPGDAGTARFILAYDAVSEADPSHRAVVVLTGSAGDISTPGVLTASPPSLAITDGAQSGLGDMLGHGFHHALQGADHLLFLLTLLLPAPLVAVAGRWRRSGGPLATAGRVVHVVTAFTLGHSLPLIAAALEWVSVPSRPVEVVIAASVAVAAVHAIRPLAVHAAACIALGFGLVHGLAFAGILADPGLDGTTSVLALLAFNVGIELAQLAAVALVLPSVHVLAGTRAYRRCASAPPRSRWSPRQAGRWIAWACSATRSRWSSRRRSRTRLPWSPGWPRSPAPPCWLTGRWAVPGSNRGPRACKARALTS